MSGLRLRIPVVIRKYVASVARDRAADRRLWVLAGGLNRRRGAAAARRANGCDAWRARSVLRSAVIVAKHAVQQLMTER